jgi:hypothetical protein
MRDERAQVPRIRIGHPDGRDPIVLEQVKQVPSA